MSATSAAQDRLMRHALTDARRLDAADTTRSEGEVGVATRIYLRLALGARHPDVRTAAKERLEELTAECDEKIAEVGHQLAQALEAAHPSAEIFSFTKGEEALPSGESPSEIIIDAFDSYQELVQQYGYLPNKGREVRSWLARERAKPEYAVVLNEEEALDWWLEGQEYEESNELCCAYHMYERGTRLLPAPSAVAASARLESMRENPTIVEAARRCAELQWCDVMYTRAARLLEVRPERAHELYVAITHRAPDDSPVYEAAQEAIDSLALD